MGTLGNGNYGYPHLNLRNLLQPPLPLREATYGVHLASHSEQIRDKWEHMEKVRMIHPMSCFRGRNGNRLLKVS